MGGGPHEGGAGAPPICPPGGGSRRPRLTYEWFSRSNTRLVAPRISTINISANKADSSRWFIHGSDSGESPVGVLGQLPVIARSSLGIQVVNQFPKMFSITCIRDLSPRIPILRNSFCARLLGSFEAPAYDITILDRIVVTSPWSSIRLFDVWVTTVDIKDISPSAAELPSEIDEAMEMNTPILVYFSADDALSSQSRKVVHNPESIEGIALAVRDEGVAGVEVERHVCPECPAAN